MREESEREVRERIEDTRARMADTVEEIGARVNPDRLQRELKARARGEVDEWKRTVKRKARSTMRDVEHEVSEGGRGLWQTIKENPIPATMVGVGLAWLVANGGGHDDDEYERSRRLQGRARVRGGYGPADPYVERYAVGYAAEPYAERYAAGYITGSELEAARLRQSRDVESGDDTEAGAKERVRQAASRVQEKASDAADTAREKASELTDEAADRVRHGRERAGEWVHEAEHQTMRAEHRVEYAVRENPLAAGAVAAALGFAAGLMAPETQREHELFGRTRDRVLDRAEEQARRMSGRAHDVAREKAGEAARRAVDESWPVADGEDHRQTADRSMTEPGRGA